MTEFGGGLFVWVCKVKDIELVLGSLGHRLQGSGDVVVCGRSVIRSSSRMSMVARPIVFSWLLTRSVWCTDAKGSLTFCKYLDSGAITMIGIGESLLQRHRRWYPKRRRCALARTSNSCRWMID